MGLNDKVSAERVHIGFFGLRNAGKSSVVNAVTGQSLSLVSETKGTTTDPVQKAMELLPIGPVVIIDTPGIDDVGTLGEMRVKRALQVLDKTDIAILVVDADKGLKQADQELLKLFEEKKIPHITVYNKSDLLATVPSLPEKQPEKNDAIYVSAKSGDQIYELKERIGALTKAASAKADEKRILADLIQPEDVVVLVVPIDSAAPKGRLILPQQQTIRDVLESGAISVVTRETELPQTLRALGKKPSLVITDSQAFQKVNADTPADVPLTSFSILFARYKGDLKEAVHGATQLDKLQNGDTVEIITSRGENAGPSHDWLNFVKSPKARNKIRQWFTKERRTENMEEGRDELTRALRKRNLFTQNYTRLEVFVAVADDLGYPDVDSLYTAIGEGQVSTQNVITHILKFVDDDADESPEQNIVPLRRRSGSGPRRTKSVGVSVKGVDDVWVKLAKCCTPVPGDQIVGFVTRGAGVSVHREDCVNVASLKKNQPERLVDVSWTSAQGVFLVKIQVEALDRGRLLSDIARVLSDAGVNIVAGTISTGDDRVAISQYSFEMADMSHLNQLLASIRKIDGVFDVYRLTGTKDDSKLRIRHIDK